MHKMSVSFGVRIGKKKEKLDKSIRINVNLDISLYPSIKRHEGKKWSEKEQRKKCCDRSGTI